LGEVGRSKSGVGSVAGLSWQGVAATGLAAAAVPGLLSALVTRALMRAVAWVTGDVQGPELEGLLVIVLVYVLALLPGCLALAYSASRWSWTLFGAGAAFLLYAAVGSGIVETPVIHDLSPGRWLVLILALLLMLAAYGAQVVVAASWATGGGRNLVARVRRHAPFRGAGSGNGITSQLPGLPLVMSEAV